RMATPRRWRRTHRLPQRQRSRAVPKKTRRYNAWFAHCSSCNTVIPAATCGCAAPRPCGRLAHVKCSDLSEAKKFRSTMNTRSHPRPFPIARTMIPFHLMALLFSVAGVTPRLFAAEADAKEPAALEHALPADPGSQHVSVVRNGVLSTRDGLTLRLTTDFGPVNITQLEAGSAPVVRYTVRIQTDARGAAAQQLLDAYSLKAKSGPSGVEITGMLPPQAARSAAAQFWVQFEVAVPRSYNVEVNSEAGDIITSDIGGPAYLHTLGGNINTGRIGSSGVRDAAWGRGTANRATEGRPI